SRRPSRMVPRAATIPHARLRRRDGAHHAVAAAGPARPSRADAPSRRRRPRRLRNEGRSVNGSAREAILTVEHLTIRFGGLVAIDDLSFSAARGDITAIIGPNGAGKTTAFNCITGFYKPDIGRLTLR